MVLFSSVFHIAPVGFSGVGQLRDYEFEAKVLIAQSG
jgi:hypothetical protein